MRWILLLLVVLLGALQYRLWWGTGGRSQVRELQATVAAQEQENATLRQRNADLAAEVQDLKTGTAAVEERARSELGMIKPGEVFYRVVDDPPDSRPAAAEPKP